jgi:hypothetical protein
MWSGDRFRFGAAVAFEFGPDSGEGEQGPVVIRGKLHDILLARRGIGLRRIFGEAIGGTRQRLAGFSQPLQCGDVVLRILVTGGPPVRGGGGMPQRIITISRSAPALRTTGAASRETRPACLEDCRRCRLRL